MPTYDYRCKACGHIFEKRSSIADRNIPVGDPCPICTVGRMEKLVGGAEVCMNPERLGRTKIDGGFQEVLAKIHNQTPGSNLGDKLSRTPNKWTPNRNPD